MPVNEPGTSHQPRAPIAGELQMLQQGLQIQARVIRALFLREIITRFGRNNIGFLWLFVEPILFVSVVTTIWTATRDIHGSQIPIAAFTLTGYTSVLLWRNTPVRCIGALSSNQSLLYHRYVTMLDVYLARILLEFAGITLSFLGLGVVMWLTGWIKPPENVLQVIAGWLLLAWFGVGLALTLGPLSERFPAIQKLWVPVSMLLFVLSGTTFLVDSLPTTAQKWMLYLPMVHGLEFLREGFFGSYFHAHYNLAYLISCSMLLTLFGLSQVRRVALNETQLR